MFLVRDIFQCKPGMAKELVKTFKSTFPYMKETNGKNPRVMTDAVSSYWTVVLEIEFESLSDFENTKDFTSKPEVKELLKDYMTFVEGGYREIFRIE